MRASTMILTAGIGISSLAATGCNGGKYSTFTNHCSPIEIFGDNDLDGFGAGEATTACVSDVFTTYSEDCDENVSTFDTAAGFNTDCTYDEDTILPGFSLTGDDCNDSRDDIFPDAEETCDGEDDDCDGLEDENDPDVVDAYTLQPDTDGDGYGDPDPELAIITCNPDEEGYTSDNTDCDDTEATVHPNATEYCDGVDNDCDELIDETELESGDYSTDPPDGDLWYPDVDGDGYGVEDNVRRFCNSDEAEGFAEVPGDCDDNDSSSNPDAADIKHLDPDNDTVTGCNDSSFYALSGTESDATTKFAEWSTLSLDFLDIEETDGSGTWMWDSTNWYGTTSGVVGGLITPDLGVISSNWSVQVDIMTTSNSGTPNGAGLFCGDVLNEEPLGSAEPAVYVIWGNPIAAHEDWTRTTYVDVYQCYGQDTNGDRTCSILDSYYTAENTDGGDPTNIIANSGDWVTMVMDVYGDEIALMLYMADGSEITLFSVGEVTLSDDLNPLNCGVLSWDDEGGTYFENFSVLQ